MKKLFLTLTVAVSMVSAFGQNSKAIVSNGNFVQIGDFDPGNASFSNNQFLGIVETNPKDFIYDAKNGHAIYQDKFNGLVFCSISGNQVTTKNVFMITTVMAPVYIPSAEKIVCFSVQKEFNGYGSNEDNLFLSTIDVKKGITKNILKFTDLSINDVAAPFYGKNNVMDRFTGKMTEKEVAISKPMYVAEKDLYVVLIRDVTGTNRLYKLHVTSSNALASSARCDYNIIDMTHVSGTDIAKTLFFEKSGTTNILKVGDFNITTNSMSNVSVITTFTGAEVNNGSIKFSIDQTQLFVSRFDGNKTTIYNLNTLNNQSASSVNYSGYIQFDYGFNDSYYKKQTRGDIIGLYPNPSTGLVYFKNNTGFVPSSIKVYDNIGQLVRSIKIEEISSEIQIDLNDMAPGMYNITVDMPDEDFNGKVIITN
jgi:hypothetical protein